jgi:hypothetical protein
MDPVAAVIAVKATKDYVRSALPDAPVVPEPPPRNPRVRSSIAAFLRASAGRRARLADRVDPCAGRAEPVAG